MLGGCRVINLNDIMPLKSLSQQGAPQVEPRARPEFHLPQTLPVGRRRAHDLWRMRKGGLGDADACFGFAGFVGGAADAFGFGSGGAVGCRLAAWHWAFANINYKHYRRNFNVKLYLLQPISSYQAIAHRPN